MKRHNTNLLAGRASVYHIFPFTASELGETFDLDAALCFGTLPGLQSCATDPAYTSLNVSSGYVVRKWYLDYNVTDTSGTTFSKINVTIMNFSSQSIGNYLNIIGHGRMILPEYYIYNDSNTTVAPYSISITRREKDTAYVSTNLTSNENIVVALSNFSVPIYDDFDAGLTTNFSSLADLGNVINATIGKTGLAQINFTAPINVTGVNLNNEINISHNYVYVESSSTINSPANITMFGLPYNYTPVILKNGNTCSDCTLLGYDSGTLSFNVNGFSTYTTINNSRLDISNDNGKITPETDVYFYATYVNYSSSESISGADCIAYFNDTQVSLNNYNGEVYYGTRTFSELSNAIATWHYNVSCSKEGFETMNKTGSVQLSQRVVLLTQSHVLEGMIEGASLVVSPLDNDNSTNDVVLMGNNDTQFVFGICYNINNSSSCQNERYYTYGSIGIVDYNHESNKHIIIMGFNSTGIRTSILKKE